MDVDKQGEREAFEKWAENKFYDLSKFNGKLPFDGAPSYQSNFTQHAHKGWQARASHDAALREELANLAELYVKYGDDHGFDMALPNANFIEPEIGFYRDFKAALNKAKGA